MLPLTGNIKVGNMQADLDVVSFRLNAEEIECIESVASRADDHLAREK